MTGQCKTCGGWIPPLERIYTDEGTFHDRLTCLTGGHFETLVSKYGCRCPTATQQEWHDHLDEEHRVDVQAVSEHVVRVEF